MIVAISGDKAVKKFDKALLVPKRAIRSVVSGEKLDCICLWIPFIQIEVNYALPYAIRKRALIDVILPQPTFRHLRIVCEKALQIKLRLHIIFASRYCFGPQALRKQYNLCTNSLCLSFMCWRRILYCELCGNFCFFLNQHNKIDEITVPPINMSNNPAYDPGLGYALSQKMQLIQQTKPSRL